MSGGLPWAEERFSVEVPVIGVGGLPAFAYALPESVEGLEFQSLFVEMTTSALVANRCLDLVITNRVGVIRAAYQCASTQPGGTTFRYTYGDCGTTWVGALLLTHHIPVRRVFQRGDVLVLTTNAAQVGDVFTGGLFSYWARPGQVPGFGR